MAALVLALRRSSRNLGQGLALSVVLLGLLQPRTFVWCRAESGHAELEALDDACCAGPGLGASCTTAPAPERGTGGGEAIENGACHDVLVEAPAGLPHDERLSATPSVEPAPTPVVAAPPGPVHAPHGRDGRARAAAHDRILTTVLRN